MIAGLPGTGIGGLFYIAGALFMPIHRAARGGGHGGRTWLRVGAQAAIAAGILAALYGTGVGLGMLLAGPETASMGAGGATAADGVPSVVRWVAVVGTLGILSALLLGVEAAALMLRLRGGRVTVARLGWRRPAPLPEIGGETVELPEVA